MPSEHERLRNAEVEYGILITNLASALVRTSNMNIKDDATWGCAISSATDFVARTRAEVILPERKQ